MQWRHSDCSMLKISTFTYFTNTYHGCLVLYRWKGETTWSSKNIIGPFFLAVFQSGTNRRSTSATAQLSYLCGVNSKQVRRMYDINPPTRRAPDQLIIEFFLGFGDSIQEFSVKAFPNLTLSVKTHMNWWWYSWGVYKSCDAYGRYSPRSFNIALEKIWKVTFRIRKAAVFGRVLYSCIVLYLGCDSLWQTRTRSTSQKTPRQAGWHTFQMFSAWIVYNQRFMCFLGLNIL